MPPVAKKAQPSLKPVEDVKASVLNDDEPGEKPELPDDEQDTDADKNESEIESAQVDEVRPVDVPCRRCFPDGWPVAEHGASVNCPHGHAVTYGGEPVFIDKARAIELGFLEE